MKSSGVPSVASAVHNTPVDCLRLGRTGQSVTVRLTRFWDSRRINKDGLYSDGEFMGITLLLLDEQDTVIHGFIPAKLSANHQSSLRTGEIVRLDRFEVARCAHMYKITEHQFMIRFTPSTRISEIQAEIPVIKEEKFMVRRYDHLLVLANTNLELPDVVGEIRSVQGSDLKNPEATTRVVVRLSIDTYVFVYVSLWDEAASDFRRLLQAGDRTQSVMLVTTVNPKVFGGNMYLNSTQGTQFFFDTSITQIAEFLSSVQVPVNQDFTCIDTLEGVNKKELVSIGDLNTYISNANEQTHEADFLCKARIVGVISENGWTFVSCTACNKKLEKRETSFYCNRCLSDNVTGVIRYCVEIAVDDGKDSATFVVFDKEMTRLTRQEASVLAEEEGLNGGGDELPSCLEDLIGKEFVFQIRITPFNFTSNHRTFTVSTMTEDTQPPEEGVSLTPANSDEKGSAGTSKGMPTQSVDDCYEADDPEDPNSKKKRKVNHE